MPSRSRPPSTDSDSGPTSPAPSRQNVYSRGVGRYGLEGMREAALKADWAEIPASLIIDAILAVTRVGDGITFSRTSDGGAFSLTILSGGKSAKVWPNTEEQCAEVLQQIITGAS